MKKYIFTESQIKKIVNNQILEQSGEIQAINSGSIEFLNKKGIPGSSLTEKIKNYQKSIRCDDTGHMLDCVETMRTNFPKDFALWKSYIAKNKPLFDWLMDKIKKGFGVKDDPKSFY